MSQPGFTTLNTLVVGLLVALPLLVVLVFFLYVLVKRKPCRYDEDDEFVATFLSIVAHDVETQALLGISIGNKLMITLTDSQQVALAVNPTTKAGNPASVDGAIAWSLNDENGVVTLEASEDGKTCVAKATGKLGVTQIVVEGDADLGEGVKTIKAVVDIEVIAGGAATFNVSNATPTEQE